MLSLWDIAEALAGADSNEKKEEDYETLGISFTYDPTRRVAKLEARPKIAWAMVRVGGPTGT